MVASSKDGPASLPSGTTATDAAAGGAAAEKTSKSRSGSAKKGSKISDADAQEKLERRRQQNRESQRRFRIRRSQMLAMADQQQPFRPLLQPPPLQRGMPGVGPRDDSEAAHYQQLLQVLAAQHAQQADMSARPPAALSSSVPAAHSSSMGPALSGGAGQSADRGDRGMGVVGLVRRY
mmetsp:Transcript_13235/g.33349  ORF Transcript_13235/g.33349 Transcript_13235/m.33349 type:complete len:178 (-) Transcript_13235:161-694(-)